MATEINVYTTHLGGFATARMPYSLISHSPGVFFEGVGPDSGNEQLRVIAPTAPGV